MERTLSLILDKDGYVALPLLKMNSFDLDKYTSTRFENSDQIRECFKDEIDYYLAEKGDYIEESERISGRKNNGRIVLIETVGEPNPYNYYKREAVLYKKHVDVGTLREIMKLVPVMKKYVELNRLRVNEAKLASLIQINLIKKTARCSFKSQMELKAASKFMLIKDDNFYERVRLLVKAYKQLKKPNGYKKIEDIYTEIKLEKEKQNDLKEFYSSLPFNKIRKEYEEEEKARIADELMLITATPLERKDKRMFNIDGVNYYPGEVPFDNDELVIMDSEFKPDGIRR